MNGQNSSNDVDAKRQAFTKKYRMFKRKLKIKDSVRLLMRRPGGLPGLIVIGAQKSGTTTLYRMMSQHPDMMGHPKKEIHYFNNNYFRGNRWYRTHFPDQDGRLFFDVTPDYLCHPYAAERMASEVPNAKLIVLLREPVSRALSQYWMEYGRGEEHLGLQDAFAIEAERLSKYPEHSLRRPRAFSKAHFRNGYFWRGLYAAQLHEFYQFFDRQRVLVLRAEDFAMDPQSTFDQICDFASVPRYQPEYKRLNQSRVGNVFSKCPDVLRQQLAKRYQMPNAELFRQDGIEWRDNTPGV